MKVVSVEATRMDYPRIKPVTVPRAGTSRGETNLTGHTLAAIHPERSVRRFVDHAAGESRCWMCRHA